MKTETFRRPFKLRVGGKYLTREGFVVEITEHGTPRELGDPRYPWLSQVNGILEAWDSRGRWEDGGSSLLDFIAELVP